MQSSDAEIIKRCIDGDTEAFSVIVERYKKKVYGIAYGISNNCGYAEEISQEVFIRVFRSLSRFRGRSTFSTWLYRIAVNCSINYVRRLARRREINLDDVSPGESKRLLSAAGGSPDACLAREEFRSAFARALSGLKPKHRTVFTLHEVEGMPIKEIAEITGTRSGTVKSRLYYAREKMRDMLAGYI